MTIHHSRTALFGLALLMGAGALTTASAREMMQGSEYQDHTRMMQGLSRMKGEPGEMEGMKGRGHTPMMHGTKGRMRGKHGGGMGMMPGGMGMAGPGMHGPEGMLEGLDLNDQQQEQLLDLRSKYRQKRFARMADMLDLRDKMHALMAEERPDPEAVREVHGRMASIHGDMTADRIRMRNDIREMLTDEQREQLRADRDEGRAQPRHQGMSGIAAKGHQRKGHHGSSSE